MREQRERLSIDVFSTCPQSSQVEKACYLKNVADAARWSEQSGCKGILIYTDNSIVDPWLVAQQVIQHTKSLCPLVAVQPIYMHPYTVAKMVTSLGYLHNRRIFLNVVAGGFKNDLNALNDPTPHDKRYERLIEYVTIVKRLLATGDAVSFDGAFYKIDKLRMSPTLPPELFPGLFVSGSSDAGLAAAKAMNATAIKYPKPPGEYEKESSVSRAINSGIRVGIIARDHEEEAWKVARDRFPVDRKGQLMRQLAHKISDSVWHEQLAELGATQENNPYWLVPFENYKTNCPYLVGSYKTVAKELARYIGIGFRTFILDIPPSEEELHHAGIVFEQASS
jgi:alkanesulfonate monooxygenase